MEGGEQGERPGPDDKEWEAIQFGIKVDTEDDARLLGVERMPEEDSLLFQRRIQKLKDAAEIELAKTLGIADENDTEGEITGALYDFAANMAAKEHGVSLEEFEINDDIEPDFDPFRYIRRKQIDGEL